ncbi:hypothetical protein [Moraxella oculi]|uniref:Uncharacterized protein n=1 Tax=Moraxella oculi TaxID=2940516 RepID=A0ABW8U7L4_9GAMM
MNQLHYTYKHEVPPTKVDLPCDQNAGHGDHWAILTDNISEDVPNWLQAMLENPTLPSGLTQSRPSDKKLLLAHQSACHIKQILSLEDGTPKAFINAFPAVDSPYGVECHIERIIRCEATDDAILRLKSKDGTVIYAFDQLYAVNRNEYKTPKTYYVNLSAWAYHISPSNQNETILVDDPVAIRYHRAFNDIVSANGGHIPKDIEKKIRAWQPNDSSETESLLPVEINFGHSCIYLFGETFGQEDEAWCQGQVLGISHTLFFDREITLFDVVILREPDIMPLVVRIAAVTTDATKAIKVHDYIQANIWLQAAIYAQNQR